LQKGVLEVTEFICKALSKDNTMHFLASAVGYRKNAQGIWEYRLDRGYFPERLDPESEEAKALDRFSKKTFGDRIKSIMPNLENALYMAFA
jgi:hypothetical protein